MNLTRCYKHGCGELVDLDPKPIQHSSKIKIALLIEGTGPLSVVLVPVFPCRTPRGTLDFNSQSCSRLPKQLKVGTD